MANISQITQELTQFPPAPQSDDPATFNERADATVAHLHTHVTEQNALADQINAAASDIDQRGGDIDEKYDEIVEKYNDFSPKYADFFVKYDDFSPKYDDMVIKHGETVTTATSHKAYVDTTKERIDEALLEARSYINSNNGDIIDDAKTSKVSTFSSEFIKENIQSKMNEFLDLLFIDAVEKFSEKLMLKRQKVGEIICVATTDIPPYTKYQNEVFNKHKHAFLFRTVDRRRVQTIGDENFIFINANSKNLIYTGVKND